MPPSLRVLRSWLSKESRRSCLAGSGRWPGKVMNGHAHFWTTPMTVSSCHRVILARRRLLSMRSTLTGPSPGVRMSWSRLAVLISTGNASRFSSAMVCLGSSSSGKNPPLSNPSLISLSENL
ncbi:MAG: hypothetical protein F4Y63_09515 [Chloroflexi bacterium]|nr:hypothetical protein [Chloroflexota bacterium]MYF78874.1 hypothetical protein [Chloroflexota bacterium]